MGTPIRRHVIQCSNEKNSDYNIKNLDEKNDSSFFAWLWPELKRRKIPYRSFKTDGDDYRFSVGDQEKITMDWKILDVSEIEYINYKFEPYTFYIKHDGSRSTFVEHVQFCEII